MLLTGLSLSQYTHAQAVQIKVIQTMERMLFCLTMEIFCRDNPHAIIATL